MESVAGLAAVASFYTGDLGILRLALQLLVMVIVGLLLLRDVNRPLGYAGGGTGRSIALALLSIAFVGVFLSFALSLGRGLSVNDVGVFLLQGVVAVLILLSRGRERLALAVGSWAVAFGLLDAVANLMGVAGLIDIQAPVRRIDGELEFAYPGLSGSTLGGGFVAFAAVCRLALAAQRPGAIRWISWLLVLLLLVSLDLIAARRYFGLALVAITLFLFWRPFSRIGLQWVSLWVAALFLGLTFTASEGDTGNVLRGLLMLNGVERALEQPIVGRGPTYFVLDDRTANFIDLAEAGVTESQLLDFAISYGMLSALCFLFAILLALAVQQGSNRKYPAIVLTCLTAELFFGGTLASLAGTLLFYGSLGACLEPATKAAPFRRSGARPEAIAT
jgi:hypothetical protein